ncbi:MAG: hypothetical protein QM730_13245 [Anaerolineales bacterium]
MANDVSIRQKQIDSWEVFLIICLSYTFLAMLSAFFVEDLFRFFTPFFAPFLLLFIAFIYLALSAASLLYIPFRIMRLTWRVFIPIAVNLLTFFIIYNFSDHLPILRVVVGFQINEKKYNQAANWIIKSIQNGDLNINDTSDNVTLPKEYKSLADNGRVWVTNKYGVISIYFYRGGGLFEYVPGYNYRSDDANPPIEDGDILCIRRISPHWYDCN